MKKIQEMNCFNINLLNVKTDVDIFMYGNCGMIALSNAFDLPTRSTTAILHATGCKNPNTGITFKEANKAIEALCKSHNYRMKYVKNTEKLTYLQLISIYQNSGTYIVNFDNHMSCIDKGIVYDGYYLKFQFNKIIPLGWWKIK